MAAGDAGQPPHAGLDGPALREALFAEKDVQPIGSADDWACEGIFKSDEELREFRDWVTAERKANPA